MSHSAHEISFTLKKTLQSPITDPSYHSMAAPIIEKKPAGAEFGRLSHYGVKGGEETLSYIDKIACGERLVREQSLWTQGSSYLLNAVGLNGEGESYINFHGVFEKIYLDFYQMFADAASSHLGLVSPLEVKQMLDLSLQIDDEEEKAEVCGELMHKLRQSRVDDSHQPRHLIFRSRMIQGYKDLGPKVVAHIREHGAPPEVLSVNGNPVKLTGLMAIAAVAKILGDSDWLGGQGANTGYTMSSDGQEAHAVIVDAGAAMSIKEPIKDLNVRTNNNASATIFYHRLSSNQKQDYLQTLQGLAHLDRPTIECLVVRNLMWNRQFKSSNGAAYIQIVEKSALLKIVERIEANIVAVRNLLQTLKHHQQKSPLPQEMKSTKSCTQNPTNTSMSRYHQLGPQNKLIELSIVICSICVHPALKKNDTTDKIAIECYRLMHASYHQSLGVIDRKQFLLKLKQTLTLGDARSSRTTSRWYETFFTHQEQDPLTTQLFTLIDRTETNIKYYQQILGVLHSGQAAAANPIGFENTHFFPS